MRISLSYLLRPSGDPFTWTGFLISKSLVGPIKVQIWIKLVVSQLIFGEFWI
jgi:hypothetical protein